MSDKKINICILGASGYTGAELIRLLSRHPFVKIMAVTANSKAGASVSDIFPHLSVIDLPPLLKNEEVDWARIDVAFCALPHGITQEVVSALPPHVKVIDLSADFRHENPAMYEKWYGHPHRAIELQKKFVYGLTEFYRAQITGAHYVANTGCYVAASLFALLPLVQENLLRPESIVIDAKSGVSGAGRTAKEDIIFTEISEGFHAYAVGKHRHMGEIDQELSKVAGQNIHPEFTPHLLPQNRGILATIYADLKSGCTPHQAHKILSERYRQEYFIHVLPMGQTPHTRHVKGSNFVKIGLSVARDANKIILTSVLDNLVKGASGQAIQNMNVMLGFPEWTGLEQLPLFP